MTFNRFWGNLLLGSCLVIGLVAIAPRAISEDFDPSTVKAAPVRSAGIVSLDLPDSSAKEINLTIVNGRFSEYSVGNIRLTGSGIDFKEGVLDSLDAEIKTGNFDNLIVDKMTVNSPGFQFDTMQLLNSQTFVLKEPVDAEVSINISEAGINQFLASPKTLKKVESAITKQTGGIALFQFSNPVFQLLSGNKIKLDLTAVFAQGVSFPLAMRGNLDIQAGKVVIQQLALSSADTPIELPADIAKTFESKLNELIDFQRLGKNTLVLNAETLSTSSKALKLNGHAQITRLKFGS
ncbi:MAG: LmeA family phospholipid-binding protein [Cyanobacteria bacterium P01_H01_bin.74]